MDVLQISLFFVLFVSLIVIYVKREEDESLLFIKLFGYNFLGSFRFNFNEIAIPIGFLIYLGFLRPSLNKRSKRFAALLGLLYFILGLVVPFAENTYFQRQIEIKAPSTNVYNFNFQRDLDLMRQRLEMSEDVKLGNFRADFEHDGKIRELNYELVTRDEKGLIRYYVELNGENHTYRIQRSKMDQWLQYQRMVDAPRFFEILSNVSFEELRPKEKYDWYSMISEGERVTYGIEEVDTFIIEGEGKINPLSQDQFPIEGYYFSIFGMSDVNANSSESGNAKFYMFDTAKISE